MIEELKKLKDDFTSEIENITSISELENLKVRFLGKKGKLTEILKNMGKLSAEERPKMGKIANEVRDILNAEVDKIENNLRSKELNEKMKKEYIDITLPMKSADSGHLHPLKETIYELEELFESMGFMVLDGPEIETVENNFDLLNTPDDHPSRDLTDTFYFDETHLLRSQTSPVQIHAMKKYGAPIKMISAGRTFRTDEVDDTHSPMFNQIEGLVVDKNITLGNLKSTIDTVLKKLFGDEMETRYRPHYFPFTEPSLEVDATCAFCKGKGCEKCNHTGWSMELMGCGMVHPNVLRNCGIDPEVYQGFAFGMGIDRLTMVRCEINNIRLLYDNDKKFLEQF